MNERIKLLAEQAHVYAGGHSLWCHAGDVEKFAELIVQECLGIIDEEGSHEGGSIRSMEVIKQHFGVEE